jgi:hypothetical protein
MGVAKMTDNPIAKVAISPDEGRKDLQNRMKSPAPVQQPAPSDPNVYQNLLTKKDGSKVTTPSTSLSIPT